MKAEFQEKATCPVSFIWKYANYQPISLTDVRSILKPLFPGYKVPYGDDSEQNERIKRASLEFFPPAVRKHFTEISNASSIEEAIKINGGKEDVELHAIREIDGLEWMYDLGFTST